MALFLLKFTACIVAFYVFYSIALEQTTLHHLKRFYLLSAVIISFVIPTITFTEYVTVVVSNTAIPENTSALVSENITTENYFSSITNILLLCYVVGVLLFLIRFVFNLRAITQKINRNTKIKDTNTTNVLLSETTAPHTFLNFIFFQKEAYLNNAIPQEVIVHEKAHANQKHSIDILIIEILQIVFWFHPAIYLFKNAIKLNHEFLADQEVLKKGFETANYQNILLSFSSSEAQFQLANAINYSLIKKRFTVMKTQTSKRTIWLRSLLIVPLTAMLLFSFSNKTIIENYVEEKGSETTTSTITILISEDNTIKLNSSSVTLKELSKELIALKATDVTLIKRGTLDHAFLKSVMQEIDKAAITKVSIVTDTYVIPEKEYAEEVPVTSNTPQLKANEIVIEPENNQEGATKQQIKEYNTLAKKYNTNPNGVIRSKEVARMKYLYNLMSPAQRKTAQPFPKIPPAPKAPKAPKTPKVKKKNKAGEIPPPPPPPKAPKAPKTPKVKKKNKAGEIPPPPPPPKPPKAPKKDEEKEKTTYSFNTKYKQN